MCAKVQKNIIFTRMHVKFFPFERLFAYNHGGRMGVAGFRFRLFDGKEKRTGRTSDVHCHERNYDNRTAVLLAISEATFHDM